MLIRVLLLMMLFGPGVASAANIFTPAPADRSLYVLDTMFGQLGIFGGGMSDGFATSVAIFNGAALIIGGVLVVYSLIVGTIGTAHDGEVMGKKYSSVWIPLRTVLATALILPVIGGSSYCLMQLIVGWLIVQGVGLADEIWKTYMDRNSVLETVTLGLRSQDTNKLAWQIFSSSYCAEALNIIVEESVNQTNTGSNQSYMKYHVNPDKVPYFGYRKNSNESLNGGDTWSFGMDPQFIPHSIKFTKDICGTVEFVHSKTEVDTAAQVGQTVGRLDNGANTPTNQYQAENLKIINAERLKEAIRQARQIGLQGTENLIATINAQGRSYAHQVANNEIVDQSIITDAIKIANATYHASFKEQIGVLLEDSANLQQIKDLSSRDGWVMAGGWFMKLTSMQDVAGQIENMRPTGSYTDPSIVNPEIGREYSNRFESGLAETRHYNGVTLGINEENIGKRKALESAASSDSDTFSGSKLWSNIINTDFSFLRSSQSVEKQLSVIFKELATTFVIQKNEHPMIVMKKLGEWLFTIANGLIFLNVATGEDVQAVLKMFTFMFGPMLFALGFTLNYVMPMMPFMIWLGCFLGWLILCVEAIIAAPIWAVMHLSMSGDDMVGTGAQGYKLVLSLMLRPALMIFGFIAALTIMQVLGQFVNMVYVDIFTMAQQEANATTILISALAFPALYLGCMWVIIIKSMEVVYKIPDQLLQWFGGGGSQLAQSGESVGGLQSQAFAATQTTGRMMGGAGEQFYRMRDMQMNAQRNQMMQKQQDNEGFAKDMDKLDANAGVGASEVFKAAKSGTADDPVAFSKTPEGGKAVSKMGFMSQTIAAKPGDINTSGGRAVAEMHQKIASGLRDGSIKEVEEGYNKYGPEAFEKANGVGSFAIAKQMAGIEGNPSFSSLASNENFQNVASSLSNKVALLDGKTQGSGVEVMSKILEHPSVANAPATSEGNKGFDKMGVINAHIGKMYPVPTPENPDN